MIDLIVIAISAITLALFLIWWRGAAFRVWIEAPKYSMLRQERRFDDQDTEREPATNLSSMASTRGSPKSSMNTSC
jgi:hypothetical protein